MRYHEHLKYFPPTGHPWEMAKGFDTSLALGEFISKDKIPDPHNIELQCKVNNELRQKVQSLWPLKTRQLALQDYSKKWLHILQGSTDDMIFRIPYLLSFISTYFTLEEGDVVLTGTPSGVGPVKNGDKITGEITGVANITFNVVQRAD